MPNHGTRFSPFYMVYWSEAVRPTDIDYGSPRIQDFDEQGNDTNLEDAKDKLEEAREVAVARSARYQQAMRHYHTQRVKGHAFQTRDLILRLAQDRWGFAKISPPWEGPYVVAKVLQPGSSKLGTPNGTPISNPWNIE